MSDKDGICRICGNTEGNKRHSVREMMFGTRDVFSYLECGSCGCLQLQDIPRDMSRYYPPEYYSFEEPEAFKKLSRDNPFSRFLRQRRSAYLLEGKDLIGRFFSVLTPAHPKFLQYIFFFKKCRIRLDSRILDVGCGRGKMLSELAWYGFTELTGADLYIEADFKAPNVAIRKCDIFSLEDKFDLIMFNHSFEHMDDPLAVLSRAGFLLSGGGSVMIRIPTVSSFAWQHYRTNWVALDAPRHLFLYSLKSLEILAQKIGFRIIDVIYDATDFQFWGSEQYLKDIPLRSQQSYYENPAKSIFTEEQIKQFGLKTAALNREKRGDKICVFLSRSSGGAK